MVLRMINAVEFRKWEVILKGVANHNRLKVLDLLERKPNLSVADISDELKTGYQNISDHIRKLAIAGLVMKRSDGPNVLHKLTPRAAHILAFCKKLK